jgi:HEAT repeat protein
MSPVYALLLALGMLAPAADTSPTPAPDTARLREMLYDSKHPHKQSQAALLLVQSAAPEAAEIVRQGLKQTDSPEVFKVLAFALQLCQDRRFVEPLWATLSGGPLAHRHAAAAALAELAETPLLLRLRSLLEDDRADPAVRQLALKTLGRCGRRQAMVVLLDQLSSDDEAIRKGAADALTELTGQSYGLDIPAWRSWWQRHQNLSNERWLEERLAYQASRAHRLEGDLERAKAQVVSLHQQLYTRLPASDRLNHVQTLADAEDPTVRALAIAWGSELLPAADAVGQRVLADLLLRLSHDGTPAVQRAAVLALGRVADRRAFERLQSLLQHGQGPLRAAAARALGQQVRGSSEEAFARQRQVVPALQKALEDTSLEVVVEAAESLGTLGVPEAGPVLAVLLRHPSASVRQTAALALERVADRSTLDGLLAALDDPVVTIRFSLVGALGHAAGDGRALNETQHSRLLSRLEDVLVRDADPGVRSRAATVLGESGSPAVLPALWKRVRAREEDRVQEKAWAAMVEVMARSNNLDLVQEWNRTLSEAKQDGRRLQLLTEVSSRWQKREETKPAADAVVEILVPVQLSQGKWASAYPLVHALLARQASDAEVAQRLQWLLTIGQQALQEGSRAEALRVVQEAQPFLGRQTTLAGGFEKLEKQARMK